MPFPASNLIWLRFWQKADRTPRLGDQPSALSQNGYGYMLYMLYDV